jgi:hypothetical protein
MLSRRDLIATVPAVAAAPMAATAAGPERAGAPGAPTIAALAVAAYPHPKLGGALYGVFAERYLSGLDDAGRAAIAAFIARLDADAGGPWASQPVARRDKILAAHAGDPAYAGFLWRMAEILYRDPKVWALIGFDGSALERGGWLNGGFDDIDWLPAVKRP